LPPSVGVGALHPHTYGYFGLDCSMDANPIQEDAWGIKLKISGILRVA